MDTDLIERQAADGAMAQALTNNAQLKSEAIRKRLAAVAQDLRAAAALAGADSESLLNLAIRFEQHSKLGETYDRTNTQYDLSNRRSSP